MAHLFRVWSDQSNGLNSRTLFAPAAASTYVPQTDYNPPKPIPNEGEQLRPALLWKKSSASNPFIFFTPSFLFALQTAIYKRAAGESGMFVTCFQVTEARTPGGERVDFRNASAMLKEHEVQIRNRSDGSVRDYADVVMAKQCVVLGGDTTIATLEALEEYLYQLYPSLSEVNNRRDVRFNFAIMDLRKYLFQHSRPLTASRIVIAAKLAAAFSLASTKQGTIPVHLLAHALAMQRNANDDTLKQWLNRNATVLPSTNCESVSDNGGGELGNVEHPEVKEFYRLRKVVDACSIHDAALCSATSIPWSSIEEERCSFRLWSQKEREEYRAARPACRSSDGSKTHDRKRKRQTSNETDYIEGSELSAARNRQAWRSREGYRARRDLFRSSSSHPSRRRYDRPRGSIRC